MVDVVGYEGLYKIDQFGNIYRKNGMLLKPSVNEVGYVIVNLFKNNKAKCFRVHRLVAIAFLPNENNLPEVNHIDGNKKNNCLSNLEWNSVSENRKHAYATGLNRGRRVFS